MEGEGARRTQLGTFREDSGCDTSQRGVLVSISPEDQWDKLPVAGRKKSIPSLSSVTHIQNPQGQGSGANGRRGKEAGTRPLPGGIQAAEAGGAGLHCGEWEDL